LGDNVLLVLDLVEHGLAEGPVVSFDDESTDRERTLASESCAKRFLI
jgi:hypothetical protein